MTEEWANRQTTGLPPTTRYLVQPDGNRRYTTITRPDEVKVVQITDNDQNSYTYGMLLEDITYSPPSDGGRVLKSSRVSWISGAYDSPRPEHTYVYDEKNQMTETYYGYNSRFNAPTEVSGQGYSGQYKRAQTEYLNSDEYVGRLVNAGSLWSPYWEGQHIFNLPRKVEVFGGEGRLSYTEYEYDNYDNKVLINYDDVPQYDLTYNPNVTITEDCGYKRPDDCPGGEYCDPVWRCDYYPSHYYDSRTKYRGNITKVTRYSDAVTLDGNSAIVENYQYDIAGNLRVQSTACCEQTSFNYTYSTRYAWPESTVRGSATDPAAQNTSSAVYNLNTGLVLESKDANGGISTIEYNPNTLRPIREFTSTNAYVYHEYNDSGMAIYDRVYEAGESGNNYASATDHYLDGKGRVIHEVAFAQNGNAVVTDEMRVIHDNLGRVVKQSRPFRTGAVTINWIDYEYDYLDRPIKTVAPDNSVVQRFYNESSKPSAAISNEGQTVRSRDAWGRERWGRFDDQNRLVEVVEPNPSGDGTVANGGMSTQFVYDTVGNLIRVNQGNQTRKFKYDSFGRLTHQKLAERDASLNDNGDWVGGGAWSDVFRYDNRSNLVYKKDARGVVTGFAYINDSLNRLRGVQYITTDVPGHLTAQIPNAYNVTYDYMTIGDKMRVKSVFVDDGMGNQAIEYDNQGRVSQVTQTFTGREAYPLVTNYLWDTLDRVKEVVYPQQYGESNLRKVVVHNYDIASRLNELKYDDKVMASAPVFNAGNQITSLAVGDKVTEKYDFDSKTGLLLSQQVVKGGVNLLDLKYNYTQNDNSNNDGAKTGQLTSITDLKNTARNRAYSYDVLGRINLAKGGATATRGPDWEQVYSYDRFGNRTTKAIAEPIVTDKVFVDDSLPAGAVAQSHGGDGWNWVNSNPAPVSGGLSHQSNIADESWSPAPYSGNVSSQTQITTGIYQHVFWAAPQNILVPWRGVLYAYVYLDPENVPEEIMLQWVDNNDGVWKHRAYWGANKIDWGVDGTVSRKYMGALPQAGGWVRLEVPASAVGLEGKYVNAMAFTIFGGRANWDLAGVAGGGQWEEQVCEWDLEIDHYVCRWETYTDYSNQVLMDDSIPAGAQSHPDSGSWNWVGADSREMIHQHYFEDAVNKLEVKTGDILYQWVYLDPANMPKEIMLQWNEANWEHRAYWGANKIGWGADETAARFYMGGLPAGGGWVRLEVPASAVGLEGKYVDGMAFSLYGGRATWDRSGLINTTYQAEDAPVMSRDGFANLSYNPTNNRVTNNGFEYDPAGNQTSAVIDASGRQQKYVYDSANRLTKVTDANGAVLATYTYGSSNERLVSTENGVTTYYAREGGQVVAEYEAAGGSGLHWKMSYVYMGGRLLATDQFGGEGCPTCLPSGVGGIRYYHPDRLGTRLVTDASDGAAISENITMPFGNQGAGDFWQNPEKSNLLSKKRFTSYDRSDATGLDYAINRQYSAAQGRFTQVDPIGMSAVSLGDPQTLNLYAYCGNDPVNRLDPDGTSWFGSLLGWIGKGFKLLYKVAAITLVVAVAIIMPPFLLAALMLGVAAVAGLAGWHNGKLGEIAGLGLTALGNFGKNYRTPPINGSSVGPVGSFFRQQDDKPPIIRDSVTITATLDKAGPSLWKRITGGLSKAGKVTGRIIKGALRRVNPLGLLGDMEDVSDTLNPQYSSDLGIEEVFRSNGDVLRSGADGVMTPEHFKNTFEM